VFYEESCVVDCFRHLLPCVCLGGVSFLVGLRVLLRSRRGRLWFFWV